MNDNIPDSKGALDGWRPAGFWIRFAADLVDSVIVYFPIAILAGSLAAVAGASQPSAFLMSKSLGLIAGAVYYTFLTGRTGQTWGKKIFDIKVVSEDGAELGYGKAFLRWCAYLASYITLGIGFVMAGWNTEKRALHDYMVGTRVVRRCGANEGAGPAPWKVIGILAAAGLALAIMLAAGAISWVHRNREKMMAQGQAAAAEGKSFGEKTAQDGCVTEAVSRLSSSGFLDQALDRIFLENCLTTARASEGLCADVPPKNSIMASVSWRIQRCEKLGHSNDQACGRLMEAIQGYCAQPGGK